MEPAFCARDERLCSGRHRTGSQHAGIEQAVQAAMGIFQRWSRCPWDLAARSHFPLAFSHRLDHFACRPATGEQAAGV
jgi:hypothetical protein